MLCPKCGAPLEEDSKFCVSCGAEVTNAEPMENTPQENPAVDANVEPQKEATSEKKVSVEPKKKKSNLGMVVGTLLILIGLSRILTAGTSISPTSFGGDFYTYTYQGIVAVSEILASIEVTLGWVIVSIGAAMDVLSMRR